MNNNIENLISGCESELTQYFSELSGRAFANERKVLHAFREAGVSSRHFSPTEGYGYDDTGRDTLDRVFSLVFKSEDALVRPQIANGTHAIFLALSGLLEPGDSMLSVTGAPYDTLQTAIGGNSKGAYNSLSRFGIKLKNIDLKCSGDTFYFDKSAINHELLSDSSVKMLYVQRSRGYSWRNAVPISAMKELFSEIKKNFPKLMIVVDNCYGAFTEEQEPTEVGADIICGSLIKNVGGGLAPTGGYIAGKKDLIERIAFRQTVPGAGKEVGSYAASYRPYFQGLFMAPHTVLQCLKTASLFAAVFQKMGYSVMPAPNADRSDIVQSIHLDTKEQLITFCRAVQAASPVESDVVPEPWDMPGYEDQVIMAAGTFVQGSTAELSADAPLRKPYTVYLQGALSFEHGRIALEEVVEALLSQESVS